VTVTRGRRRLVAGDDLAVVAGQLGRRPHPMSRVVHRCPFGFPAVVETLPYDAAGRPFPTLFYATCPTLVAAVGVVESGGGVRRSSTRARDEEHLRRSLAAATRYVRRRRRTLAARYGLPMRDGGASLATGIGGVAAWGRRAAGGSRGRVTSAAPPLKCLHAHAAHALARPGYLLGEAVLAEAGELWCDDRRCAAFVNVAAPSDAEAARTAGAASGGSGAGLA
jgi:hypothetical protein